jgi:hypothetical protein
MDRVLLTLIGVYVGLEYPCVLKDGPLESAVDGGGLGGSVTRDGEREGRVGIKGG